MILIDVIQRIPGFEKPNLIRVVLTANDHSAPGFVKPGNKIVWTATVDDPQDGKITLVTVEHDEALDPVERDVKISNTKNYVVNTQSSWIVKEIIKEMDDYHN